MKTVLITGKGRSGTTWLAQILNSHPHCCYKHEPFLESKASAWRELRRDLRSVPVERLRERYAAICRRAIHGVDQPPFPQKSIRPQSPFVLHALYGLGTRVPALRGLFELYARPRLHAEAEILIKDVNFPTELLPDLCEVLQPRLVPIVRNPYANIASYLQGVKRGLFSAATAHDRARLRGLLEGDPDDSRRAYAARVDELGPLQFEALRWRVQVEPLIAFGVSYPMSRLVVYEDLCRDPFAQTGEIFTFLGWPVGESTRRFLSASTAGQREGESGTRGYYTVYRDPRESLDKWRKELSTPQQAEIASVFRHSPYVGLWKDLPV